MNNLWLALEGARNVLLVGLLLGAGLPAIFSLGIKALSWGSGSLVNTDDHTPHIAGRILGYLCFAIVLGAVALGIGAIVASGFGMRLSFDNVIPMFVPK
ncbi:MAG TPA: hypothetical protein K8V15_05050 [Tessaracoccus flavescens]|uniref:Transmembrane protein n=1 Tax=Tessaracoccus flavescens TaxID=399497 RepID=A0A921EMY0_9ACTN|nr:hypothetical protein [Tessaracoccus flavescens]